jgi:hypothetical protein
MRIMVRFRTTAAPRTHPPVHWRQQSQQGQRAAPAASLRARRARLLVLLALWYAAAAARAAPAYCGAPQRGNVVMIVWGNTRMRSSGVLCRCQP